MKTDIDFKLAEQLNGSIPATVALEFTIDLEELQDLGPAAENIAALLRLFLQAHGFDAELYKPQVIQMISTSREECPEMEQLRIAIWVNDKKEIGLNFSSLVEGSLSRIYTWQPEIEN